MDDDKRFVDAYSKATGKMKRIPGHWLGHPVLGKGWSLTPSAKKSSTKTPSTNPVGDKTPATGDDEGAQ